MDDQSANPPVERRRSQRSVLHLFVEITGVAPDGRAVQAAAEVVTASRHGALLKSPFDLLPGSQVTVRNPENDTSQGFKVVWTAPVVREGLWNVGLDGQTGTQSLWDQKI